MSGNHLLDHGGITVTGDLNEQARRAVSAFRQLQPTLTSYARVLSGSKTVRVVAAAQDNGSTDGQNIYFRPPIALGIDKIHDRFLCDKRDDDGLQLCAACRIREAVLVTIYHEIAHISQESFARTTDRDKAMAIKFATKEVKTEWCERVRERIEKAPSHVQNSYMGLAHMINQFMPTLLNALEDARVNTEMFKARPGLRKIFEADERHIFEHGYEVREANGLIRTQRWNEAPMNAQVIIGTFCKAVGYNYSGWFHRDVVKALDDEELGRLISEMEHIKSVGQVYNLTFKVLARLRELGFCATEEDPDDTQADSDDTESQDGADPGDAQESGENGEPDESVAGDSSNSDAKSQGSDGGVSGSDDSKGDLSEENRSSDERSSGNDDAGDDSANNSGDQSVSGSVPEGHDGLDSEGVSESDSPGSDSSESSSKESDEDSDPIDTGADDGYGGTRLIEDEEDNSPRPEMGTPDDVEPLIKQWGSHEEKPKSVRAKHAEEAVDTAIIQGLYFTTASQQIGGVVEYFYDKDHGSAWSGVATRRNGGKADILVPEAILQPAIMRTRRAFTDNARGDALRNRKSGRVNAAALGRRAWNQDERLFQKNLLPGRRDYCVEIGMDISGSTTGRNLALEKRAIYAQADILSRTGVEFEIIAHTGDYASNSDFRMLDLQVYHVKDLNEPWNDKTKARLAEINSCAANIDGHALEFLRKRIERSTATDRIIMYYSDGKMPLENYDEELEILQREIKLCKKLGITLMGVGIRTDSPKSHGLDTVQIDEDNDLVKVIEHLSKRLSEGIAR